MPQIIPIKDLKNTSEISDMCHRTEEPIYITKNGYGDMVIMSMESYESTIRRYAMYRDLEMSERQTKTERRKNYEKEREKKFTDWKHIPCNVYSMDSFDSDGGCTASWSKWNRYWICSIQLLVSPFYRGKHGNLYDYRLDGAGTCHNMPFFRRYWAGTVD